MKISLIVLFFGFIVIAIIYYENNSNKSYKKSIIYSTDQGLMEVNKDWINGKLPKFTDLCDRLGPPHETSTKDGVTIYGWSGNERAWLYVQINPDNKVIIGMSVIDSY